MTGGIEAINRDLFAHVMDYANRAFDTEFGRTSIS
jgi:hypothetical protein